MFQMTFTWTRILGILIYRLSFLPLSINFISLGIYFHYLLDESSQLNSWPLVTTASIGSGRFRSGDPSASILTSVPWTAGPDPRGSRDPRASRILERGRERRRRRISTLPRPTLICPILPSLIMLNRRLYLTFDVVKRSKVSRSLPLFISPMDGRWPRTHPRSGSLG